MKHALFVCLLSSTGIVFFPRVMSDNGSLQRVHAGTLNIPQSLHQSFCTGGINGTTVAEDGPGKSKKKKKKMSRQMNKKKKGKGKRK